MKNVNILQLLHIYIYIWTNALWSLSPNSIDARSTIFFISVSNIEHIDKFKEYLNCKHQNINFTSEFECDGKLPFVDNLID